MSFFRRFLKVLTFVAETVSELREFQSVVTLALKKF